MTAAAELFTLHGVHGTSLKLIADRAGTSKPAVYHHFRSKENLVSDVVAPVIADIQRVVRTAEWLADIGDTRAVVLSGLVETAVRHRGRASLLRTDPVVAQLPHVENAMTEMTRLLRDAFDLGADRTRGRVCLSVALTGIFQAVSDHRLRDLGNGDLSLVLTQLAGRLLAFGVRRPGTPEDHGGDTDEPLVSAGAATDEHPEPRSTSPARPSRTSLAGKPPKPDSP